MKKLISFSLYGNNPKYTFGAVENMKLSQAMYPGWTARFYIDKTVPDGIIQELRNQGTEIVDMSDSEIPGMYWRFLPLDEADVEIVIVRDVDSRLNTREASAVKEWLGSEKILHIMRDHLQHGRKILGGMWGLKKIPGESLGIAEKIDTFCRQKNYQFTYGDDQIFLDSLYEKYRNNMMVHDELFYFESFRKKFPTSRQEGEYVGSIYDENNILLPSDIPVGARTKIGARIFGYIVPVLQKIEEKKGGGNFFWHSLVVLKNLVRKIYYKIF